MHAGIGLGVWVAWSRVWPKFLIYAFHDQLKHPKRMKARKKKKKGTGVLHLHYKAKYFTRLKSLPGEDRRGEERKMDRKGRDRVKKGK